jgi:hypothetical protein
MATSDVPADTRRDHVPSRRHPGDFVVEGATGARVRWSELPINIADQLGATDKTQAYW